MSDMLEAWDQAAPQSSSVTVEELDQAAAEMMRLREEYDKAKSVSVNLNKEYEKAKYKLMGLMELSGKSKFIVDGLGTFSRVTTKSYKVPTEFSDKKKLIDYFHSLGETEFYQFVTVHSATLNSYVNSQLEDNPNFHLDGCGEPKVSTDIRIRRK